MENRKRTRTKNYEITKKIKISKRNIVDLNEDVLFMFFDKLNHNDLKRLSSVSRYFNQKIKYYMKFNRNFVNTDYLFWFNKNFCYFGKDKDLKNKKEGNILKRFLNKFVYEFNISYCINDYKLNIIKNRLIKCDCEACNKKILFYNSERFMKSLRFISLFHYFNSFKFNKFTNDIVINQFSEKVSKIIKLDILKSKKILLLFLTTRGIKYIYNCQYYSVRTYSINIKQWKILQEAYYIFVNIYNYTTCLLSDKEYYEINKLISSYFLKDECVRYLFTFMDCFNSIHNKKKVTFVNDMLY